ncbi:receptor activity-modifying protein 3-like [Thalassophryne amazonica]|uniref:receptor activity-modifying protein 3-like n=1 Tax=Thalassophryne amazonica TaxID=390379 RepID=UPI001472574B|nr:receptor activity-modifying protein 3-like [Thalassophryne amazonica]
MDTNECAALKLFVVGILFSTWIMRESLAADSVIMESTLAPRFRTAMCNKSHLQGEVEVCGENFKRDMARIDEQYWCNLTYFIREYHSFTSCTENKSKSINCYWPNPLVENYIIHIHKHLFSNCTLEEVIWADPPDETLTVLILIPVFLTLAMIALVVWCSKRSDILA